jgi:hypothetical protein
VLVGFLREHGINAQIAGLNGHVAVLEGKPHILDPDVGLVVP